VAADETGWSSVAMIVGVILGVLMIAGLIIGFVLYWRHSQAVISSESNGKEIDFVIWGDDPDVPKGYDFEL
jgi:hypothetical protein